MIFSLLVTGFKAGFRVYFWFFFNFSVFGTPVIFVVFTALFWTFTVTDFSYPLFKYM